MNPFWNNLDFFVSYIFLESDKCRDLSEAIEYPQKTLFEDVQFPPVASVHAEWHRRRLWSIHHLHEMELDKICLCPSN